jgi:magnesium transporter
MQALPIELVGGMLASLALDEAARLARLAPERVEALLARLAPAEAEALRAILAYPAQTAGGLMDPRVLALPEDLTAAEALDRCRERPRLVRYNLYVLDAEGRLIGVLNLNELLMARETARLSELMVREPLSIQASAGRANVAAHPGWRRVHSLPVVDERGRYLGAIRYRTWRRIEDGLRRHDESETTRALGELLSVGAGGLVRSLTRPGPADEE